MSQSTSIPLPQGATAAAGFDSSEEAKARFLQDEVEVVEGGETFTFRIPTIRDEIKIGSLMPRLRRQADPESAGDSLGDLDPSTYFYIRSISFFLTCMKSTDAKWVFSPDKDGKPLMKWTEWSPAVTNRVLNIALEAQQAIARFHGDGAASEEQSG